MSAAGGPWRAGSTVRGLSIMAPNLTSGRAIMAGLSPLVELAAILILTRMISTKVIHLKVNTPRVCFGRKSGLRRGCSESMFDVPRKNLQHRF
jgi:hypothetical protein